MLSVKHALSNEHIGLILNISVVESQYYKFAERGIFKTKCPKCRLPIIINLYGLPENKSLTPEIDWHYIKEDNDAKRKTDSQRA